MLGLSYETEVVDRSVYDNSVRRFREAGILLPTFAELAAPDAIGAEIRERLAGIDPDAADPLNLFRVHWWNGAGGKRVDVPEHLVLPSELTGVDASIVVLLADRFPMIRAHKVLATYGCLAPRIITGQFDPTRHRAIWPSTGNYCRGGVAVSRIMGCHGVAVLPEGMSRERFEWLERWVASPEDIVRTPGTESDVKEIYDKCAELAADPANVVFNQFSEFGNYLAHLLCTGTAGERVMESLASAGHELELRAWVAATGSGGTLAAGDHLKERFGSRTVAVEALECPTLLYNGFGEHNIQGIGDKHVPLIQNVYGTDFTTAVSDSVTDSLLVLFNTPAGRDYLVERRGLDAGDVKGLERLGLSSICNIAAAIKTARYLGLSGGDAILTVATDGGEMYCSEVVRILARDWPGGFDGVHAAEVFGRCLQGIATDHLQELTHRDRERVFNLGYFTWVEQQGVTVEEFSARREPSFWSGLRDLVPAWDEMIREFNRATGLATSG